LADGEQTTRLAAASEQPAHPPGHFRVNAVVDPAARDTGADVVKIGFEYLVERAPRFPVLFPTRLPSERPRLQPAQLAQKKEHRAIVLYSAEKTADVLIVIHAATRSGLYSW
jgi:hypothetical protein